MVGRIRPIGVGPIGDGPIGPLPPRDEELLDVTSTSVLHLPVNCVLAGQQKYSERVKEYEIQPQRTKYERPVTTRSLQRLSQQKPSFTVMTTKTGRD